MVWIYGRSRVPASGYDFSIYFYLLRKFLEQINGLFIFFLSFALNSHI